MFGKVEAFLLKIILSDIDIFRVSKNFRLSLTSSMNIFLSQLSNTATSIFSGQMKQIDATRSFAIIASAFRDASDETKHHFLSILFGNHKELEFVRKYLEDHDPHSRTVPVDFIGELPEELAVIILSHLSEDTRTLGRASRVSKKWRRLIQDNDLVYPSTWLIE